MYSKGIYLKVTLRDSSARSCSPLPVTRCPEDSPVYAELNQSFDGVQMPSRLLLRKNSSLLSPREALSSSLPMINGTSVRVIVLTLKQA